MNKLLKNKLKKKQIEQNQIFKERDQKVKKKINKILKK